MWDWKLHYHTGDQTMLKTFLDLIRRYRQIIVGVTASHTHMDGIRKLNDADQPGHQQFNGLMLSAPGIDPGHGNNPAFKLVIYDKKNFEWENAITFYQSFYPARSPGDWDDHRYGLRDQLSCPAGLSLKDCIGSLTDSVLEKRLLPIYKTKAPPGNRDADEIHVSLNVNP